MASRYRPRTSLSRRSIWTHLSAGLISSLEAELLSFAAVRRTSQSRLPEGQGQGACTTKEQHSPGVGHVGLAVGDGQAQLKGVVGRSQLGLTSSAQTRRS